MLERMEAVDASASEEPEDDEAEEPRGGFGSLGSIIYLLVLTWAAGIASFPLNDNSFFTHLATGRLILDEGRVPSTDPYTFTAFGEPWTVQSWLASVAYAGSERLAGQVGLRLLVLAVFLISASIIWRLSEPASSLLLRLIIVALALSVATGLWSERPYMVGVIGIGVVWLALEGRLRPWVLVPLLWIWGNAHGSFVFAAVLVAAVIAGSAVDRRATGAAHLVTVLERKVAGATLLGTLLVAAGPVGPRLLVFPLVAARRSEVFDEVVEWQSPGFRRPAELAYLCLLLVTLLLLGRAGTWRLAAPAAVFVGGSLYAQRNIVLASIVLVAVASRCAPEVGALRARTRPGIGGALAAAVTALVVLVALTTAVTPTFALRDYPARPYAWMVERSWDETRVAGGVSTGNMLEVLDGAQGTVFVDDRFDLLPDEVFEDYLVLDEGGTDWDRVLDAHDIDVVLWARNEPLASILSASDSWRIAYSDSDWVVSCRRSSCPDQSSSRGA